MTTEKKKPTRKKRIRYTAKLGRFICEQIENGLTLSEVCRKYPDKMPTRRVILNWQKDNPEFKEAMDFAYYCWVQCKMDRLTDVSTKSLTELYPNLEGRDAMEARRAEMDALKFISAKLAPALSTRWDKSTKVEHTGIPESQSGPQIAIVSYCLPQESALESNSGSQIIDVNPTDESK